MSNGSFSKAESEAILSGGQPAVNRFLVETVIELKHGQYLQRELLEDHCGEANVRDQRIAVLEGWRATAVSTCTERVRKLIEEEHETRHGEYLASLAAPRREDDPKGENHRSERGEIAKQVWFMWMIGSKLSYVLTALVTAFLVALINYLWTGNP